MNLISTVPLTNIEMTLTVPAGRLENLTLDALLPEICSPTLTPALSHPMGEGAATPHPGPLLDRGGEGGALAAGPAVQPYLLRFATCTNQSLIGMQQLAWLHFSTVCTQQSAFVNLEIPDTIGTQPDGTLARNFAPQSGRLIVVGEEPLLEATLDTHQQPTLTLYAKPNATCVIEATLDVTVTNAWQSIWTGPMTNLWQTFQGLVSTNQALFFRARREP